MTPATTSTCRPSTPAIVSGINRKQLCHPAITVNQKWVGATYCFVEFPLVTLGLEYFTLVIPVGINSLNYGYAVRSGNNRYFLSSSLNELPMYAGEKLYGDAVLEGWNKITTPETVTIAAACFNITEWKTCNTATLIQLLSNVNKRLWIQLYYNYGYSSTDTIVPQFLHTL